LCIAGSDTILGADLELAQSWVADFEPDRRIRISVDAIGSGAGVRRAVEGGCVNVLAMSEAMTAQQFNDLQAAGVSVECAAEVGYDVIAFVTDISNRTGSLRQNRLQGILRGTITDWNEVSSVSSQPIYILARPVADSGTTRHVMTQMISHMTDEFPGGTDVNNDGIIELPNYIQCESNESCLDLTLATPGSLYWVSSAWMRTKPTRYLRVMPILRNDEDRPINPLTDDFQLAEYPTTLARPLYLYVLEAANTNAESTAQAKQFLDYVRSLKGQEVLEAHAFITYFDSTANIPLNLPPGFITGSGVREVCRTP
jgi:ABC-type phosphate transport system substrate-binding protein